MLNVNCELFFIVILYIAGVGVNPGSLLCTTCVRPGCKRGEWEKGEVIFK